MENRRHEIIQRLRQLNMMSVALKIEVNSYYGINPLDVYNKLSLIKKGVDELRDEFEYLFNEDSRELGWKVDIFPLNKMKLFFTVYRSNG